MSLIAEFLWLVMHDPDSNKHFEAKFAPTFIERHGKSLTREQKEILSSGDSKKISDMLRSGSNKKTPSGDFTWTFSPPNEN